MKNIFAICRNDLRRISSNVVAIVLILGLAVVPCLYAWFNIFSNWDPYRPETDPETDPKSDAPVRGVSPGDYPTVSGQADASRD